MVQHNITVKAIKFIAKDLILDLLLWPLWWYGEGVKNAFQRFVNTLILGNRELSLTIWMKNIFVPMFGDVSFQGRLISFFMRLIQIIGRSIIYLFWFVFSLLVFFLWFVLPIFIIYQVLFNINLLPSLL
jgi:hypothetical protein